MIDLNPRLDKGKILEILENDYIDRNKYLNGVLSILDGIKKNKIIALDGEWGSGKTWFLKSLEYLMNQDVDFEVSNINKDVLNSVKQEYMTFYYNAWENDDAPSAMLSLIYKLVNDGCKLKEKESAGSLPRILNALIKFGTNGSVDIKNDIFGDNWTNKQITNEIKTSEEIKEKFKDLIKNLLVENKNKILVIVDEIDRCKPLFAIELLENIKHFYDDDRVVFIIATNNKQLGASVCKVYGEKYDGYLYLDRFFDINLELPENYRDKYLTLTKSDALSNNFGTNSYIELYKDYKLTMREYNRFLDSALILNDKIEKLGGDYCLQNLIRYIFVPLALCLKIKNKAIYYEFVSGNLFEEISELINNNEYFFKIAKIIVKQKDISSTEDVEDKVFVMDTIKQFYKKLFVKCDDIDEQWEYKEALKDLLDILSMM